MLRKVWRRVDEFLVGPYPIVMGFRRTRDRSKRRQIYPIPWPAILRWWEDPVLHFNKLGLLEIDWWDFTVGVYWHDNDKEARKMLRKVTGSANVPLRDGAIRGLIFGALDAAVALIHNKTDWLSDGDLLAITPILVLLAFILGGVWDHYVKPGLEE